jgi:ABC-type transport system involved in cytochrome bd biosynthesis fused ATPase/permease subunit
VMEQGRLTQSGTHAELIRQPGLYRTLWSIQTGEAPRESATVEDISKAARS